MSSVIRWDKWKPWQRWVLVCACLLGAGIIFREYNWISANTIQDMRLTLHADQEFPDPAVRELVLAAAVGDSGRIEKLASVPGFNPNATGVHYRITPLIWALAGSVNRDTHNPAQSRFDSKRQANYRPRRFTQIDFCESSSRTHFPALQALLWKHFERL